MLKGLMPFRAMVQSLAEFLSPRRNWTSLGGGRPTVSQERVDEYSALNYSAVWCATRLLCGTGASLPLPIFRGRDSDSRSKDRNHPAYRLLNGSMNPEMTSFNARSVLWQYQLNWGGGFAEIVREGNAPEGDLVALWPIHPDRVEIKRDEDGVLYYDIKNGLSEKPYPLETWQMFHVPSILTTDGICGLGVIEHARESIGAGIAAEKYGANFFGGAAIPRIVIQHQGTMNAEAREAFRKEWEEIHGGADGSKVALLGGGATVYPLTVNAEDSQFLQTRQFGIEEIARWYGVPPHLLQHLLQATFNNIEHLGINFVQYSLIPWMRIWEQEIWFKLFRESERDTYFAEHNVDALLRGDTAARASFYQQMTSAALMTRNEVRKLENLDPVEGGDTFLVQGAMVPLDDEGKPVSEFAGGGVNEPVVPPDDTEDDPPEPGNSDEQARQAVKVGVQRVLERDLRWILTKERKAALTAAKKPDEFLTRVDEFYAAHYTFFRDAVEATMDTISALGMVVDRHVLASEWVEEGRKEFVEVAGIAKSAELADAVQRVVDSQAWAGRPQRAIERIFS